MLSFRGASPKTDSSGVACNSQFPLYPFAFSHSRKEHRDFNTRAIFRSLPRRVEDENKDDCDLSLFFFSSLLSFALLNNNNKNLNLLPPPPPPLRSPPPLLSPKTKTNFRRCSTLTPTRTEASPWRTSAS